MSARGLFAVVLIFIVCSAAWLVLGDSITSRTRDAQRVLGNDVGQMFGPPIVQTAPAIVSAAAGGEGAAEGRPPDASRIQVEIEHEHRYRGLIWFSVYRVAFEATYTVRPVEGEQAPARFRMRLPPEANVDGLVVEAGGRPVTIRDGTVLADLDPAGTGAPAEVRVRYVSTGQDGWRYLPATRGLRDFELTVRTNFDQIDYPADGLSPTERARPKGSGLVAVWRYEHMLAARSRALGVLTPAMPTSGALAARIATFAPVSLFFFLVVMVTIQVLRRLRLHPLNYLLIAAGFFAFHVLLAYLVDHVTIHLAFWISAAVSVFLVVSYLRLVLDAKAAIRYAGAAQLVYLVFFSYAFFWRGWTGLTIVIGATLTLFLVMQLTARLDWREVLAARSAAEPEPEPAAS